MGPDPTFRRSIAMMVRIYERVRAEQGPEAAAGRGTVFTPPKAQSQRIASSAAMDSTGSALPLAKRVAFAERWVRSVKQECLSKVILFGERPLWRALAEYSAHYHSERNHQGKGNHLLFPDARLNVVSDSSGCSNTTSAPHEYFYQTGSGCGRCGAELPAHPHVIPSTRANSSWLASARRKTRSLVEARFELNQRCSLQNVNRATIWPERGEDPAPLTKFTKP